MRSNLKFLGSILFALVFLMGGVLVTKSAQAASETVYDALPSVSPATSYSSQPFQAQQVTEFGDLIHLGGTNRVLDKVTVTMSDYALFSTYSSDTLYSGNSVNWTHPITLNVYNVVSGATNEKGSLIGTVTQNITIPWRPAADASCADQKWKDGTGKCNSGYAFNATFDLSSKNVILPNDVIVTVAFNTQSYGVTPISLDGPYDSLNVVVGGQTVSTGSNDANSVFLNSTWSGAFVNTSLAGQGLKEDTGWTPNGTVAMQITATPFLVTNGSNGYSTIQAAIDAATPGNTINVAAGTYIEQLTINKNLTLIGAGDTTIIQSPNTLTSTFSKSGNLMKPVITIKDGATANISAMKVDGVAKGNNTTNTFFVGIGFHNAGGTLDHVTVIGVKEITPNRDQQGEAILAINADSSARTLNITNSTVSDFQKNGITLSGAGLTVTVSDNHIIGSGANDLVAQNGIHIGTGVTGSVTGNTVGEVRCDDSTCGNDWATKYQAMAIVIAGAVGPITVSGNIVSNSDVGIYSQLNSGVATITNNTLTNNRYFGMLFEAGAVAVSGGSVTGGQIGIFNPSERNTGNTTVHNVNISGNSIAGFQNDAASLSVNASQNYWDIAGPVIDTNIKGTGKANVNFTPWYANETMTILGNTTTLNVDNKPTVTLPAPITTEIVTTEGAVQVDIPSGIVITGPVGWDGTIEPPAVIVTTVAPVANSGNTASVVGSIEVGFNDLVLTFNKAVQLVFIGQAGNSIGYSHGNGTFQQITASCTGNNDETTQTNNLTLGADCKMNAGNDLVVWTKHFSTFTTYTQTAIHNGGGSYIPVTPAVPAKVTTPDGCEAGNKFSTTTGRNCNAATPASASVGKVLGAEKFNFTKFMKNGSKGTEIIELQNFLTTLGYTLTADGKFGPKTKGAVIKFQIANQLKGDGVIGALTRAALNK